MTSRGKLLKTLTCIGLSFVKILPWLVIETHGSILAIPFLSFYRKSFAKYLVCIRTSGGLLICISSIKDIMPDIFLYFLEFMFFYNYYFFLQVIAYKYPKRIDVLYVVH